MKTMFDVKTLGASNRIKVLTFLMLCAICAMAWTFVQVGKQVENRQARLADVGTQMVLSQRVAKYALAASAGDVEAFGKMESFKNEFTRILDRQISDFGAGSSGAGTAESQSLTVLGNRWSVFSDNIDEVLQGQFLILAVAEANNLLNEIMPQLMGHTQDIVDILVKNNASAEQVRLASRQAVLIQRIVNSLNAAMRGKDTESAALSFGADTKEFGRVLDGFMRGTGGIESLKGATLRSKIQEIALQFSRVSDNVGAIVENAEELLGIQTAVAEITGQSDVLFDAAKNLRDVLAELRRDSIISNELAYALGAVALLILLWMAYEALRTQRQRSRMFEQENFANQEAIMRIIDEMGDLAEGDLTVRATVTEEFTGAIADSINVTVDSLRGLVKTINDTSTRLSAAVQETDEIATNLSQESKQQAQDISAATASISEMSTSMEDVSRHADESSKVAMRSVEIAKNGGEAVQRTMNGMDTIREHIQETSKRIKRLGESSQEIGDIVELINDIAEQTNILALNASIQAAMAGEAGRGFAVVADEVQRLAERSANATKQIDALVKTIQTDTNEAVISMEKSTSGVVKGAQLTENASEALGEIENVSDQMAELIQNISGSARQQASVASRLATTMNGIQQVTTRATSGADKTSRSIATLARLAQDLDKSVAGFKLPQ